MKSKSKFNIVGKKISFAGMKKRVKETKISILKKSLNAVQESYCNTEKLLNKAAKATSRLADKIDDFSYNNMMKVEKVIEKKMAKEMQDGDIFEDIGNGEDCF